MKKTTIVARLVARLVACLVALSSALSTPALAQPDAPPAMSATRLLRRAYLTLLGRGPTHAEYRALLALPEAERAGAVDAFVRDALETPEFRDQVRDWGEEYLGVPGFMGSLNIHTYQFDGTLSMAPGACPAGTLHAGRIGLLRDNASVTEAYGQWIGICDDPSAPVSDVEPWWAPGTAIPAIGDVATENRVGVGGADCGGQRSSFRSIEGCGCGPNLIYCVQRPIGEEGDYYIPGSMRRQVAEEPARLFEHIVANDRPFSDLVEGDYTVVTRTLRMAYMRQARMTPDNAFMDDDEWWRAYAAEPDRWREVPAHDIHPQLLSERDYRFDPRVEPGRPRGIPAAGVLTTIVANEAWPRERVRAANWIRSLACRDFAPPASDVSFPPYERDPGREGPCLNCHQLIDPAAIHFKRMFDAGGLVAATTDAWGLSGGGGAIYRLNGHANGSMIADTLMTPVSQAVLDANTDARFIDFMPPGTRLFGVEGRGTIGPLGFAQALIDSGEFDRCAVRRAYQRFGGRDLVPGVDDDRLGELVRAFLDSNRNMRALIERITTSDEFALGI
ncbi:MAG: DUF1585 domain-containing protein [Sandaracinaceae bacterium]